MGISECIIVVLWLTSLPDIITTVYDYQWTVRTNQCSIINSIASRPSRPEASKDSTSSSKGRFILKQVLRCWFLKLEEMVT